MSAISSISPALIPHEPIATGAAGNGLQALKETEGKTGESFSQYLSRSIDSVNDLVNHADKSATEMATGKSENLHDAMINVEKAETAFKLLVQVRNRVLDAYHEVMRMQV